MRTASWKTRSSHSTSCGCFLGTDPTLFYLEIAARICIIYAYSLLLIRWVGGRGIAQMSTVEFLLVIALGSSVGDAMFYPEVPLLHAMFVITGVVAINKGLDVLIYRYEAVEKAIDGRTGEVIRDGMIVRETLRAHKIGKGELFESLRQQGLRNRGEVRQAYLETSGRFSFFRQKPPRRGLPIEPAWDVQPPLMKGPGTKVDADSAMACCNCGTLVEGLPDDHEQVSEAVKVIEDAFGTGRVLLDAMPHPYAMLDADHVIRAVNNAYL